MKPDDNRPAVHGWAPGGYYCKCRTCGAYFAGDKRAWMCADCAYQAPEKPLDMAAPVPELKGTYPVVLYFGNEADRDEFVAVVQQCKPGLVAKKL